MIAQPNLLSHRLGLSLKDKQQRFVYEKLLELFKADEEFDEVLEFVLDSEPFATAVSGVVGGDCSIETVKNIVESFSKTRPNSGSSRRRDGLHNPLNRQFIPYFSSREIGINFTVTDKCNIACDLCAPGCSPLLTGNITADQMLTVYKEVAEKFSIKQIVFTGGEPTIFIKHILAFLSAAKHNCEIVRIVTNGSFARSQGKAQEIIDRLKSHGVNEIALSVDDFHDKYLSHDIIVNLTNACVRSSLQLNISHKGYPGSRTNKSFYERLLGRTLHPYWETRNGTRSDIVTFSTGVTLPIGKGSDKIDWTADRGSHWHGPCSEISKRITISPSNTLMPCCGLVDRSIPEFSGKVFNGTDLCLSDQLSYVDDSTLANWLGMEGPSSIWQQCLETSSAPELVGICEACQRLFSSEHLREQIARCLPVIRGRILFKRIVHEALSDATWGIPRAA